MKRVGLVKAGFMSDDGCYTEKDFIQAGGDAALGAYVTYAREPNPEWVKSFEAVTARGNVLPQALTQQDPLDGRGEGARKQSDGSLVIGKKALRDAAAPPNTMDHRQDRV